MGEVRSRLTVYFEDPFWIGVFECIENKKLSVCKVTFGAEPTDAAIQKFVLNNYYSLQFSPAVTTVVKETKKNPKRMQREAKKQLRNIGIGTKSQEALKLQHEQNKQERKDKSNEQKEAEQQRLFELKQRKKLEKHKGH